MITLGIESSCDDTSIAILKNDSEVLSMVCKSQVELHKDFGGVVPEIAARGHSEVIFDILPKALQDANVTMKDIDLVAATAGPGLMGPLLVGLTMGKTLAFKHDIPFIGVHHLEAHFSANFLTRPDLEFPMIGLLVSGGHSCLYYIKNAGEYKLIGETRDDAVGELYDKVARNLGLGLPGGPFVDKLASQTDEGIAFTPPLLHSKEVEFSFSGLKTQALIAIEKELDKGQIAKGMQDAVVKVLWKKTLLAVQNYQCNTVIIAGGVSANSQIRSEFQIECKKRKLNLAYPEMKFCTDNGAMVARAGYDRYQMGYRSDLSIDAFSRMSLEDLNKGSLWKKSS